MAIVLPIDPTADRARRAWLECPRCEHGRACTVCQSSANCATHWQYLLSNQGTVGAHAVPDLCLPVVDGYPPTGHAAAQGRLTRQASGRGQSGRGNGSPRGGLSRSSTTRNGGHVDLPRRVAA